MKRAILYTLYFGPIVFGAILLIRSLYIGGTAVENAAPESFNCATVMTQLQSELWLIYDGELRQVGNGKEKFEPLPGEWRRWEATRKMASEQCGEAQKFSALLDMRRALANNLFLMHNEIGGALRTLNATP